MRILMVEDHEAFSSVVVPTFLSGHAVSIVRSVAEALLEDICLYDVLLVDFDLPDGKGVQVVADARARGFRGSIVGISSHDRGNELLQQAGADATCPKMKFSRVASVLDALLSAEK